MRAKNIKQKTQCHFTGKREVNWRCLKQHADNFLSKKYFGTRNSKHRDGYYKSITNSVLCHQKDISFRQATVPDTIYKHLTNLLGSIQILRSFSHNTVLHCLQDKCCIRHAASRKSGPFFEWFPFSQFSVSLG